MHSKTRFQSICAFWAAKTRSKRTKTVENVGKTSENSPSHTKDGKSTTTHRIEPRNAFKSINERVQIQYDWSIHGSTVSSVYPQLHNRDTFSVLNSFNIERFVHPHDPNPGQLNSENVIPQIAIELLFFVSFLYNWITTEIGFQCINSPNRSVSGKKRWANPTGHESKTIEQSKGEIDNRKCMNWTLGRARFWLSTHTLRPRVEREILEGRSKWYFFKIVREKSYLNKFSKVFVVGVHHCANWLQRSVVESYLSIY